MKNQRKSAIAKGFAIALSSVMVLGAPASSLGNVFAGSSTTTYAATSSDYELVDNMQDAAILHCWNWSYKTIEEHLELIAECGYSAVQTSPATQPKDYTYDGEVGMEVGIPGQGGSGNWWKLYQPVAEEVCDNGQTWLGTKAELESLCEKAESYGIKVIVDIVANHMGNITGWQNSLDDVSPQVGEYWEPAMLTDESYWHINDLQIWMSDGREHFTQGTMGMPDLNTADSRVQKYISDYLVELIDCGVDGFRFDAAKHIETPDDDPAYASDFWPNVLGIAEEHYADVTGEDLYVYGEILNTVGLGFSIDSYTKYMSVTDNSAGNHLLDAYRNFNHGSLNLNYAADKTVLWAESHDTYMNESSRYGSDMSIVRTWSMVANKDNAASLFFVRPYYSYETLTDDVDGAFRGDLATSLEPAIMGECETYTWASNEVAAINHFNNRFVNYSDNMGNDGSVAYCVRGQGIILVNFNGPGSISMSSHGLADGVYTDEVSGNTFTVSGGTISGTIESELGIAVVYQNVMPNPGHDYAVQVGANVGDGTVFYSDALEVTLSAKYADTAEYEVSTGEKGTFTGTTTISVGAGIAAGETVSVTVRAANSSSSDEETYTYTKAAYDLTNCIFFENDSNWSNVTAYLWNDTGATVTSNTSWPGEAMFECDAENGIYALAIDPNAGYNKVIFSNSGSSQTADLDMAGLGYCYDLENGTWYEYQEVTPVVKKPVITASLGTSVITGETKVTFTVENADEAYYTVAMTDENGNPYDTIDEVYTFDGSVTVIAGEGIAEGETVIYTLYASNSEYEVSASFSYTMDYTQPTISATEETQTTTAESLTVTFTANNAESATITVNGVEESFTDSVTKTFTADATVVVSVVNGTKSATETYVYTFKSADDPIEETNTIYFENDYGWSNVTVYLWNDTGSTITNNANWPGEKMTLHDAEKGIYSLEIDPEAGFNKIIFSNNGASQTADLNIGAMGSCYDIENGTWYAYDAAVDDDDKKEEEEEDDEVITVYFTNNYNWNGTIRAYYWGSSAESVSWPGVEMTYVGTDSNGYAVYTITIPDDIVGLIFTNGSAQTVDITTNLEDDTYFSISGNSGGKYNVSAQ